MNEYTRRHLTIPTDRSLAISGIANRIGNQVQDTYVAGHWLSMLPLDLLWYSLPLNDFTSEETQSGKHHGPSWSWTSNIGVGFHTERLQCSSTATLLNFKLDLAEQSAPYGALKAAVLTIEGPVRPMFTRKPKNCPDRDRFWIRDAESSCKEDRLWYFVSTYMDVGNSLEYLDHNGLDDIPIYLLLLAKNIDQADDKNDWAKGLILSEEPSKGKRRRFSRLGYFHEPYMEDAQGDEVLLDVPKWTEEFEEETIELI